MANEPFSLDEILRRHFDYPDPRLRIEGLRSARQAIEEQIVFLRDQHAVQIRAEIARVTHQLSADDLEDKIVEYQKAVNELFPKVMRGGFVIFLWSVFESSVKNIAEYVRKEKGLPFGLQELRAGDFLEQMDIYFSRVLSLRVFPDKTIRADLERLKGLRNTLAHHDGSTAELPKSLRCQTSAEYAQRGLHVFWDLHHKYVVPTEAYAAQSLELVASYLQGVATCVYKAIHPVPLPP